MTMASENNTLKTDKIDQQQAQLLQVGASGDTITLASGATLQYCRKLTGTFQTVALQQVSVQ